MESDEHLVVNVIDKEYELIHLLRSNGWYGFHKDGLRDERGALDEEKVKQAIAEKQGKMASA